MRSSLAYLSLGADWLCLSLTELSDCPASPQGQTNPENMSVIISRIYNFADATVFRLTTLYFINKTIWETTIIIHPSLSPFTLHHSYTYTIRCNPLNPPAKYSFHIFWSVEWLECPCMIKKKLFFKSLSVNNLVHKYKRKGLNH